MAGGQNHHTTLFSACPCSIQLHNKLVSISAVTILYVTNWTDESYALLAKQRFQYVSIGQVKLDRILE
jgi:hypothetical protein